MANVSSYLAKTHSKKIASINLKRNINLKILQKACEMNFQHENPLECMQIIFSSKTSCTHAFNEY